MKKIQKNDLKLDKEVISSLSENDLSSVKGGYKTIVSPIDTIQPTGQMTKPGVECFVLSMNVACHETDIRCDLSVNCVFSKNNTCVAISDKCPETHVCAVPVQTVICVTK